MCGEADVTERYASLETLRDEIPHRADDWLTANEQSEGKRWRNPARHRAWQAGRWLSKQLIAEQLASLANNACGAGVSPAQSHRSAAISPAQSDCGAGVSPAQSHFGAGVSPARRRPACTTMQTDLFRRIEILSHDFGTSLGRRPQVFLDGSPAPLSLSISHTSRGVLVGLAWGGDAAVGVDLTDPADVQPQSLQGWFTSEERRRFDTLDRCQAAMLWAVKEAVYKARNAGEHFDPRQIEVFRSQNGDLLCHYREDGLQAACAIRTSRIAGQQGAVALQPRSPLNSNKAGGLRPAGTTRSRT
jgi:phosphopantetheinyl transferase (holo-ACP synthase)